VARRRAALHNATAAGRDTIQHRAALAKEPPMTPQPRDLRLPSGSLRILRVGPEGGALVLCVPGLSANARSFDTIAAALAGAGRQVVALDLRGRGFSPATAPGSHGWLHHAEDVLEVATQLGAEEFDLVGHSMGAFVAMQAAALAAGRLRRVVVIDAVGPPEAAVIPPILASVQRLGVTFPSADAYWESIRARGAVWPENLWEAHSRYELEPVPGGVRARTSPAAVIEDLTYGASHDATRLWPSLSMPTLLVRAARPLPPTPGFVVAAALRDAFIAAVPSARAVDVDANHYGVMGHPESVRAIKDFLGP
jgi:pimeloyl-ACP methyl ester carboxylesterase